MSNYLDLSIKEINTLLKEKKIKPIDLVEEAFSRIESNEDLNCFITLNKEEAIKRAKELEGKEVDNLFFGREHHNMLGGMLGIGMTLVSWFEYTNMDIMNCHVFRSVPSGDYCLIDNTGKIHIPNGILHKNDVAIAPSTHISCVNIMSVKKIIEENIRIAEEDNDEMALIELKGLLEFFDDKEKISVGELKEYEPTIRALFEKAQGSLYDDEKNRNYSADKIEDEDDNKNTHHI